MKEGYCKYCGKVTQLIQSHIIPRAFYDIRNKKYFGIESNPLYLDKIHSQNGLKESLLCKECDGALGYLDNYAFQLLYHHMSDIMKIENNFLYCYHLTPKDFNYNNIRRFFISLIWRVSICKSISYSLGPYENIALRILRQEQIDNENLFLPIIYRKETNSPLDQILGIISKPVMGNMELCIRLPKYEIIIIKNAQAQRNSKFVIPIKYFFDRKEINIYSISGSTTFDISFIQTMAQIQAKYKPKKL